MPKLIDDIKSQSTWIITAFAEDKLNLDYTIHSFIEIDRFFNTNSVEGKPLRSGSLAKNLGPIIFSIGSYVGETIVKTVQGAFWETDDHDPQGEITASVCFPDGTIIWPIQKVMKRFQNGAEDSIYVYGYHITKDFTNEEFDQGYWELSHAANTRTKKQWWRFW